MDQHIDTEQLWDQMHRRLLGFIRGRVSSVDDAEDILQDVFVRIQANLSQVKDTQSITAWVYRIARNAITDHHRKRATAAAASKAMAERPALAGSDEADTETAHQARAELAGCMEPLLAGLSEPHRQAVSLSELQGLPQAEAARKLGLSVSGMKSRVQRGRHKLKELLLDCCNVKLDRRQGVVDYESRDGGSCENCECD